MRPAKYASIIFKIGNKCSVLIFNAPKYSVSGLIEVMNLLRMYVRVMIVNSTVEFHRWVLVKPNDFADDCQLAENRRKFNQFLLVKFEIGAFRFQHVPHCNAYHIQISVM